MNVLSLQGKKKKVGLNKPILNTPNYIIFLF